MTTEQELLDALEHCLQFLIEWRIEYAGRPKTSHNAEQRALIETAIEKANLAIEHAS